MASLRIVRAALASLLASTLPAAEPIHGAGATAPASVYARWAKDYAAKGGGVLTYDVVGSGAGVTRIKAHEVDFGASEAPVSVPELSAAQLIQFPTVIGGVVPVYNVSGVGAGQLQLTGSVLAQIFQGRIKTWNDPAIAALNAGVTLPRAAIQVVHRSDESGSTFLLTKYLSEVSPEWKSAVGAGKSVKWPAGTGAQGSLGVADAVQKTAGAIGYVDYGHALERKLAYPKLQNRAGQYVAPRAAGFQAAARNAPWTESPAFAVFLINQPGAEAWPITGVTFAVMPHVVESAPHTAEVLKFFDFAFHEGAAAAEALGFVPLPAELVKTVEEAWPRQVRTRDGGAVWASKP